MKDIVSLTKDYGTSLMEGIGYHIIGEFGNEKKSKKNAIKILNIAAELLAKNVEKDRNKQLKILCLIQDYGSYLVDGMGYSLLSKFDNEKYCKRKALLSIKKIAKLKGGM
ncbi:MAG TPA: hypothetical protein VMZ91_05200 [Candidatus Paceibacterota bacterium]|nr:hypothetical protein [Candidatus Paceibacterota bacterium]